jgi:Bacterial Ig-like domain (group 3)/Abnormal spindle-like microcephaly-assoc'd, ASPM-SPD-2-Hydin
MNLSGPAMLALQSDTTATISNAATRSMRFADEEPGIGGRNLRPQARNQRKFWNRLGVRRAFAAGIVMAGIGCSVAQAQSLIATVGGTFSPASVAVNQTTNTVYVVDGTFGQMVVFNGANNTGSTITPGGPFTGVAVNETTNTVYALEKGSPGNLLVINGSTNAVTTTVALTAAASQIAVNPVTNQIYVSGLDFVWVIDGSTNSIAASIAIPQQGGALAVDTTRNVTWVIYGTSGSNSSLAEIDGATNAITGTVQVGQSDNSFAFNATTNNLYVPDAHGNQMYVIDGATDAITTTVKWTDTLAGSGVAVNAVTNTIYASASNNSGGLVDVLDGTSNAITASISLSDPAAPGQLLVNGGTNTIWALGGMGYPALVINGATKAVTTITGATLDGTGAVNASTNTAYICAPQTIYVISGEAAPGPAFSASPSPLAFGNQTEGTTSSAMTLTVTNTGGTNLTFTTVTEGGANMADFIVGSDTCASATVTAGKTCTVSVQFDPSTTAAESATLTFADNASDSPEVVMLTGTGAAVIVPTATTTKLSASATSVTVGTSVTLTATVTPASGTPTPTGTVTFKDGTTTLGSGTLNGSGVATYPASALAVGSHAITASYPGDTRNTASASGVVTVNVTAGATTTTLTASAASIAVGASVTFTATVTGATAVPAATGTVTFLNGTTTLGTGTLSSGTATYTTSSLTAATYSVTAAYSGDTNNTASTSSAVAVTVWPGAPNVSISLSPASGSAGSTNSVVTTVTVTSINGFDSATSLSCSGLPKDSTCSFSSSSVTPGIAGTATSTLTIATNTNPTTAMLQQEPSTRTPGRWPLRRPIAIAGALTAFLLLPIFGAGNRNLRRLLMTLSSAILIATLASMGMTGCGGGPTTPNGTYSIQVTATAGSVTQNATYSLTVQ